MPSSACKKCARSEEHTSELQSHDNLVCRLLLEKTQRTTRQPAPPVCVPTPPTPPPAPPRPLSPRAARASSSRTAPVPVTNDAPIVGFSVPDKRVPNARSRLVDPP